MKLNKSQAIEVRQAQIQIGDIEVSCYRSDELDKYYLSQNGFCSMIQISLNPLLQNRMSNELKALLGADFSIRQGVFTNSAKATLTVNLIEISYIATLLLYFASKGNKLALVLLGALANESLKRKCDIVFGVNKTEQQYNHETQKYIDNLLLRLREEHTLVHGGFQTTCLYNHFSPRHVHDYVTKALVGRTATESINQVPINPSFIEFENYSKENIGINHVNDEEVKFLESLIKFKKYFSNKRPRKTETWISYTDRVLNLV